MGTFLRHSIGCWCDILKYEIYTDFITDSSSDSLLKFMKNVPKWPTNQLTYLAKVNHHRCHLAAGIPA